MNLDRSRALMVAVVAAALSIAAQATPITLSLTAPIQSGEPGEILDFQATLTNLGVGNVFLNGDAFTTSSLFLKVDDAPFFTNTPASLSGGASVGALIFRVKIDPNASSGSIFGLNSFTILGGADDLALGTLATQQFTVMVSSPAVIPEPSTITLLGAGGMMAVAAFQRRRRENKKSSRDSA